MLNTISNKHRHFFRKYEYENQTPGLHSKIVKTKSNIWIETFYQSGRTKNVYIKNINFWMNKWTIECAKHRGIAPTFHYPKNDYMVKQIININYCGCTAMFRRNPFRYTKSYAYILSCTSISLSFPISCTMMAPMECTNQLVGARTISGRKAIWCHS